MRLAINQAFSYLLTMQSGIPLSGKAPNLFGLQLALVSALLVSEMFFISYRYDAWTLLQTTDSPWLTWLAYGGYFLKSAIAFVAALLVTIGTRLKAHYDDLVTVTAPRSPWALLLAQLAAYAVLVWLTHLIFADPAEGAPPGAIIVGAWVLATTATVCIWLSLVAPFSYWRRLVRQERTPIAASVLVASVALVIGASSQQLWGPLSQMTFASVEWVLWLIDDEVYVDRERMILGLPYFQSRIAEPCSGYEGIGLVTVFTTLYLAIYRDHFKFPNALLLFPIGIIAIWCANVLRIVALIVIGNGFSPAVAVGGFHSFAGWIAFITVAVAMLVYADRHHFFATKTAPRSGARLGMPGVLLVPFTFLLATTLLTLAFSGDFVWLYPARVIVTGIVLAMLWRRLELGSWRPGLIPVAAGFAVFVLWIAMVPVDEAGSAAFTAALTEAGPLAAAGWMIFRVIGSVITVPIAEELAFRGYLMIRLSGSKVGETDRLRFSWIALIVSSVLFGLMHADWLAGIMAGLAYGLVRYHRGSLTDAIVAHAMTNLLLTFYVITTGHWSVW